MNIIVIVQTQERGPTISARDQRFDIFLATEL